MPRLTRAALLLSALALAPQIACSECDSTPCEDQCDDAYPDDERARTACYTECQQAVADCDPSRLEPALEPAEVSEVSPPDRS
ncbi:MAG: hypothetical protein AAF721_24050 [Myxococcota bacterium]